MNLIVDTSSQECIIRTRRAAFGTDDVSYTHKHQSCHLVCFSTRIVSLETPAAALSLAKIWLLCPLSTEFEPLNLEMIPTRFCNKSSPVKGLSFSDSPLYLDAALHTPDLLGLVRVDHWMMRGWCGTYHCLSSLISSSSLSSSFRTWPFRKSTMIVSSYRCLRDSSFSNRRSNEQNCECAEN